MKSTILISRIVRVVETEGSVGDGAILAEEYSAAVRKLNSRLESVQTAMDAKQISDAVRMMEDSPRILEEAGVLDFNQLPNWIALCARKRWANPVTIDKALLERVLILNESTEAVEPFLRMYRKAVRTNNNSLALQSLRRLVQIDHSQNWKSNLRQTEESVQKQMVADFRSAKRANNISEMDRISSEFADANWLEVPTTKGVDEIRLYIAEKEAARRTVEGAENLSIIRRCANEEWNRDLVFSMLKAIDYLSEKGFVVPAADLDLLAACRKRCAEEMEAEYRENRWKELCEALHAAVQGGKSTEIRAALAAPEFLDREPPLELLKQAHLAIKHEEISSKRKVFQISLFSIIGLLIVLGISGWWLKQKLFNARCEAEVARLTAMQNEPRAIDRLDDALEKLRKYDPDVFFDPRVNVFEGKLKTMQEQAFVRTNEIATILCELKEIQGKNWEGGESSVTGRLERINVLITKEDVTLRAEFLKMKSDWTDHCAAVREKNNESASKMHATIASRLKSLTARLKSELPSESLSKELQTCKDSIQEWRRLHAQYAPSLEPELNEEEKNLNEAESLQRSLQAAIDKLNEAKSVEEYLVARKTLVDFYSSYRFVKAIGEFPVSSEEVASIIKHASTPQKRFADMMKFGVDDSAFKTFISDGVSVLTDMPAYYSLYGVYVNRTLNYFAMAKDKPKITKPSYDPSSQTIVEGDLLNLNTGAVVPQISGSAPLGVSTKAHPSSDEIKNVVEIASKQNINIFSFEREILKIIGEHLDAAGRKEFLENEIEECGDKETFAIDRFPAIRRVQLINIYFTWLRDDMKVMPRSSELLNWASKIEDLAQPVRVDNVPDDLSWACMREARVRKRNSDCARLLSKMAESKFVERYNKCNQFLKELKRVADWKVEYVGCNRYDPSNDYWKKDHSLVFPQISADIKKDHPLYVLRKENERLVLKRALVPYKNKSGQFVWGIAPGMTKGFLTGEPLFQITDDGKCIDAEQVIGGILNNMPKDMPKQYVDKIPFFKVK